MKDKLDSLNIDARWASRIPRAIRLMAAIGMLGSLLALAGCIGASAKPQVATLPTWVSAPPADSASTYYGLGQGQDLAVARRNALRDIAAKIKVSIAGTVENRVSVRNDSVDRSAMNRISEEVQKTEFKNFKVLNTNSNADGVYVLLSVDREEFVRDTKEKIARLASQVDTATSGFENRPAIEQFMLLKKQRPNIVMAQGYYDVIGRKDMTANDQTQLDKFDQLINTGDRISNELSFKLQSTAADKDVENTVSNYLTNNGVRTQQAPGGSPAATVTVAAVARLDTIQSSKSVRLTVTLTVIDNNGRAVAGREYIVSGVSLTDHTSARQQAVFNLQAELRKTDLVAGLGFKFN
jgi:LPP20 lipoprotein